MVRLHHLHLQCPGNAKLHVVIVTPTVPYRLVCSPSDTGHQALAELLAGVVQTAVKNVAETALREAAAGGSSDLLDSLHGSGSGSAAAAMPAKAAKLPPPMIPGNAAHPTTLCAMQVGWSEGWFVGGFAQASPLHRYLSSMACPHNTIMPPRLRTASLLPQEDFQSVATAMDGFEWRPERPDAADFVSQKWGYRGDKIGETCWGCRCRHCCCAERPDWGGHRCWRSHNGANSTLGACSPNLPMCRRHQWLGRSTPPPPPQPTTLPPTGSWVELELSTEEAPGRRGVATVILGYLRRCLGG